MPLPKTRKIFINVARDLFAIQGFDSTTMNDIAAASGKGRRTLYTYFKNKEEVFFAVIRQELDSLYRQLKGFVDQELPPEEKLMKFVYFRLEAVKQVVERNGSLDAEFFRNIVLVERARLRFDSQEILLLQKILKEGIQSGVFKVFDSRFTAVLIHYALKGMEVPYIRGHFASTDAERSRQYRIVKQIILGGITSK